MASKEPNALSVLKFMRYFARVCKLWFNDIVQKRTHKMLGTTDIDTHYVSDTSSFAHPARVPPQPTDVIVSQPKYYFLSKEIARSLRETDVTGKDVERAWLFYQDVGQAFQTDRKGSSIQEVCWYENYGFLSSQPSCPCDQAAAPLVVALVLAPIQIPIVLCGTHLPRRL